MPPHQKSWSREKMHCYQIFHQLLCLCWKEGQVPQDLRDSKIVTLYKNKGDRSDWNNYRGISLLSILGKVFARVALTRLQVLAEQVYPDSQCGFRSDRSTTDMIFSVRQLQEKWREQRQPSLHGLCRPYQSIWPCQPMQTQTHREDWVPS